MKNKRQRAMASVQAFRTKHDVQPLKYDNQPIEMIICNHCKQPSSSDLFERIPSGAPGRCFACLRQKNRDYRQTGRGFLVALLNGTRNSSARRAATRNTSANHTLTIEQLMKKLEDQEGLCYISGIKMKLERHCSWQCSIERFNDAEDYTDENTCLICLEFQSASQWTREKFQNAFSHLDEADGDVLCTANIPEFSAQENCRRNRVTRVIDGIKQYKCYACAQWLLETAFKKRRAGELMCLTCNDIYKDSLTNPWIRKFKALVAGSKHSTKVRASRGRSMKGTVSTADLIQIFTDQEGLCAYSGLQLQLSGDFKVSLERIDPFIGYYPWNVCLIAFEFNSTDRRAFNVDGNVDGTNWSREKYLLVRKQVESARGNL
jgi:hypothetical protein